MQALGIICAFALWLPSTSASYAFYVGSSLTASGNILVGGTGEEVSSHWLQIFPAADHSEDATITVGVTEEAVLPGHLITIPQVNHTYRYVSMEYTDYWGLPAPLTNGGLNEKGVAVRDVWAPNRQELIDMTPNPQTGVNYANLARIVMERASSARHGVEIIGDLVRRYGYATYGGNTHMIADKDEGWVVWEFAGGKGLWAAERLRTDEVRVLYPGYIEDFPIDFQQRTDYMGSENLVAFAEEQGWWSRASGEPFNIVNVYGLARSQKSPVGGAEGRVSQAEMEKATMNKVPVTERDLMELVRDPRMSTDEAGYGQVVRLQGDTHPDLLRLWIAPTGSIAAPFIPWWLGVQSVPPEFGMHRYLTKGASSTFLNPDFQLQEASLFAGRLFKRVLYYMCSAPRLLHPIVHEMLVGFEDQSQKDIEWIESSGKILLAHGGTDMLHSLLTYYSHTRASQALELGASIVNALEGYIKTTGRWRNPVGKEINIPADGEGGVNCLLPRDLNIPLDQTSRSLRPLTRTSQAIMRLFRSN